MVWFEMSKKNNNTTEVYKSRYKNIIWMKNVGRTKEY